MIASGPDDNNVTRMPPRLQHRPLSETLAAFRTGIIDATGSVKVLDGYHGPEAALAVTHERDQTCA